MDTPIKTERDGAVLHVWLSRPVKRNALNRGVLEAIPDVFASVAGDYAVRAVVLGGTGPSFCAGVDLTDLPGADRLGANSDATGRERRFLSQLGLRAVRAVRECEVPTVARVQGHAIGGGALLAVACDFRVMGESAVFAIPEIDLGLPLSWGGTPLLIEEVGTARARELIMLGDRVGAEEAVRIGLAHFAVPDAELDAAVAELARKLAAKPEAAMHITKTQFRAYAAMSEVGRVTETDGDIVQVAMRAARFERPS